VQSDYYRLCCAGYGPRTRQRQTATRNQWQEKGIRW
jgi:hypothetical protein